MIPALTRILGREPTQAEIDNFEANFAMAFSEPEPPKKHAPATWREDKGYWATEGELIGE